MSAPHVDGWNSPHPDTSFTQRQCSILLINGMANVPLWRESIMAVVACLTALIGTLRVTTISTAHTILYKRMQKRWAVITAPEERGLWWPWPAESYLDPTTSEFSSA